MRRPWRGCGSVASVDSPTLRCGEISCEFAGLLKLLVHADTRRVLGVHIFGTLAAELVHLGQAAIAAERTVGRLAETVVNVATFGDSYRVAALDAVNQLGGGPTSAAA
jgi:NAD(P) transhydrogenase